MTAQRQPEPGKHCGHERVCAEEDFCEGCDNFDAFFNSCKLTAYKTSIQGKKETIHPVTNHSRWLLKIVGCASDTRHQQHPPAPDVIAELHAKVEEFEILSHDCNLDKKDCDYYKRRVVELEDEIAAIRQGSTGGKR